jgi:hypothetical protein
VGGGGREGATEKEINPVLPCSETSTLLPHSEA